MYLSIYLSIYLFYLPCLFVVRAEGGREVIDNRRVRGGIVSVAKGEGLLPWQFGGEAVGMATCVAPHAAGPPLGAKLVWQWQLEEDLNEVPSRGDELRAHPMVGHLEEAMGKAGRPHSLRRPGRRLLVAVPEAEKVDHRLVELRDGSVGAVGHWPDVLGGYGGLVVEAGVVQPYRGRGDEDVGA